MLRHPDFLYAFDVRGLYFHANLITEISTKVKPKKIAGQLLPAILCFLFSHTLRLGLTIKSYELYRSPLHPEADSFFIRTTPVPESYSH